MHLQQHTAGHRTGFRRGDQDCDFETFRTYLEGFPLRDSAFVSTVEHLPAYLPIKS